LDGITADADEAIARAPGAVAIIGELAAQLFEVLAA
jgi:hypothetical protein